MRIEQTLTLAADREAVWAFVSDVDVLLALLPGVLSVERTGPDGWRVRIRQKVGFIEADFDVNVAIVRKEAPGLLELRSEGKGVQVPAVVMTRDALALRSDGRTTEVAYSSDVQFSGRLAALGHAVMKLKARELIAEFQRKVVDRFEERACKPSP
jgi:carbon monoxide dehydrogenase subunit G